MRRVKACFAKPFSLSLLLVSIVSCGGSDSENNDFSDPSNTPNIEIEALNGIASATINKPTTIDVSPFIYGDKNNIEIAVVNAAKQNCPTPIISHLTFKITATEFATCNYQYDIKQKNNAAVLSTGEMQVLVTKNATDAYLSPMNAATVVNDGETLVTDWEAIKESIEGYEIKESSITVHGLGGAKPGVLRYEPWDVWDKIPLIYFTSSTGSSGWNYISYVAENGNLGDEKFGYIFITIADKANQAPIVPESSKYAGEVDANTETLISVKDLVTENDSDDWFLDNVLSMSAEVSVVSKEEFSFKADQGTHYVTYMVRDEHNAYSLGTLTIEVTASQRDWHDVLINSNDNLVNLTAPLTNHELKKINRSQPLVEELTENNRFEVAVWTLNEAQEYCEAQGYQIPDKAFLKDIHNSSNWPDDIEYFVYDSDIGTYRSMSLNANKTHPIDHDSQRYLSCVDYFPTLAIDR